MSIFPHALYRRPSIYPVFVSKNLNQNYYLSPICNIPSCVFYNASGTKGYSTQGSAGFYASTAGTSPTYSNNFADDPTVTLKRPAIYAKCDTTYMATARAAEIDKNSTLTIKCEVYRVDKPAMVETLFNELMDMYEE